MPECSIESCTEEALLRGFCGRHYRRASRTGFAEDELQGVRRENLLEWTAAGYLYRYPPPYNQSFTAVTSADTCGWTDAVLGVARRMQALRDAGFSLTKAFDIAATGATEFWLSDDVYIMIRKPQ